MHLHFISFDFISQQRAEPKNKSQLASRPQRRYGGFKGVFDTASRPWGTDDDKYARTKMSCQFKQGMSDHCT